MSRLDALLGSDRPRIWVEAPDYCARLLANGQAPWLEVAACVDWLGRCQRLLGSEVLALDLSRVFAAFVAARPPLRQTMCSKSRTGYALKALLADTALRAHLQELVRSLRGAQAEIPLCLVAPSPAHAVGLAWRLAHDGTAPARPDDDEVDAASLQLADFLRTFAQAGIDGLLLAEADEDTPDAGRLALYRSVCNVAAGYRWRIGLMTAGTPPAPLPPAFDYLVAAAAGERPTWQRLTFSSAAEVPAPAMPLRYVQVGSDANPERVMAYLRTLRA